MAEPAVEQKVAVAPADMPDVAAKERLYPRFVDQRHAVAEADGLVPAFRVDRRCRRPGIEGHRHQRDKRIMSAGAACSSTVSPIATGWLRADFRDEGHIGVLDRDGRDALEAALEDDVDHLCFAERDGCALRLERYVFRPDRQRHVEARLAGSLDRDGPDLRVDPDLVHAEILHLARQQRRFAHECCAETRGRPRIDALGRPLVLDVAMVHHHAVVGQRHRLLLVVRDVDEGGADALLQRLQLVLHLAAQLQVERAERLVEQEHRRLDDQRPRQRHALPLSAGKLVRHLVEGVGQAHHRQRLARPPDASGARCAAHPAGRSRHCCRR